MNLEIKQFSRWNHVEGRGEKAIAHVFENVNMYLKGMVLFVLIFRVQVGCKRKGCGWTYSNESITVQAVTGRRNAHLIIGLG